VASASELRADLVAGRERLLGAIASVSEQEFKRRPAEGGWSIAEVLAHLLATERLWAKRIELALAAEGARVEASDPTQHEEQARAGRVAPVPQLIHGLLASQRELERLIDRAGREDAFERALEHSRRGRITVGWMLRNAVEHVGEHAAQVEALRAAMEEPGAGNSPPPSPLPEGEGT